MLKWVDFSHSQEHALSGMMGNIFPMSGTLCPIPVKKLNIYFWLGVVICLQTLHIHFPFYIWVVLKWCQYSYKFILIKETEESFNEKAHFRIKYWRMNYHFCNCSKLGLFFPIGSTDVKASGTNTQKKLCQRFLFFCFLFSFFPPYKSLYYVTKLKSKQTSPWCLNTTINEQYDQW